jgi:AcrR family transcriptional regulator
VPVAAPSERLADLVARFSPAQRRTADAALELFAVHGVGGTSLQMIADALGVTKAAVYHQFPTKDAIVVATVEVQLLPVEVVLERVEAAWRVDADDAAARDQLLEGVVEVVISNRRSLSTLQRDPVLFRLLAEHPPSLHLWNRVFRILLGDDADARQLVRASVLSAVIGSVAYPFVVDLADDVVREELVAITRRLLVTST